MAKTKAASVTKTSDSFFSQAQNREVDHDLIGVGPVKIRDLTQAEIEAIRDGTKSIEDTEKRNKAFVMNLIVKSVFVDGKRFFADGDTERFESVGSSVLNPLIEKVMKTNGFFQAS